MARIPIQQFAKQVRAEALKVTWPSRKETLVTTGMVFVMVILCSLFFVLVDVFFTWAAHFVIGVGG